MGKKISLFATTLPTNIVAADPSNWPEGIIYDPDNRGKPISSLGVHEHWNDSVNRQYSINLGKPYGIELVSIPEILVKKA